MFLDGKCCPPTELVLYVTWLYAQDVVGIDRLV